MKLSFFTDRLYREEKIVNWISVGLLIFVTSFIWMPKRDGIQTIFALGFLFPLLCVLPFRKPEFKNYGGWFSGLALIFAAYSVMTSLWAPVSKVDFFIIQWLVLLIWLVGMSWLASQRDIDWIKMQEFLLVVGALGGLISLIFFYGKNPFFLRLEGILGPKNPNEIGAIYGILTLLAFSRWLNANCLRQSAHYGLLTLVLFLPLILSQSRGALVALVVSGMAALFYIRPSKKKQLVLLLLVVFVACVIFTNREIFTTDRWSFAYRDVIWHEVFVRSVDKHLWFGLGMEKFEKINLPGFGVFDHAHNAWVDTFYHTGLIGLALALIYVIFVLKKFKPTSMQIPIYLWLIYGLTASMFDYRTFFWQIDIKWFFFWIPIGLISAIHIQEARLASKQIIDKDKPIGGF